MGFLFQLKTLCLGHQFLPGLRENSSHPMQDLTFGRSEFSSVAGPTLPFLALKPCLTISWIPLSGTSAQDPVSSPHPLPYLKHQCIQGDPPNLRDRVGGEGVIVRFSSMSEQRGLCGLPGPLRCSSTGLTDPGLPANAAVWPVGRSSSPFTFPGRAAGEQEAKGRCVQDTWALHVPGPPPHLGLFQ